MRSIKLSDEYMSALENLIKDNKGETDSECAEHIRVLLSVYENDTIDTRLKVELILTKLGMIAKGRGYVEVE